MRGHDLSNRIARLFANIWSLANGGTGSALTDPNADRIMFWDDSAGAVTWLTPGTNLSITNTTLDAASTVQTTDSQQPTSDTTTVTSTGFSGCKTVQAWFAFSHTNASSATYSIEGRTSGGTWRTIATMTSAANATSRVGGYVTIANFNQATEKLAQYMTYVGSGVLDDSSATNAVGNVSTAYNFSYIAYNEVWDEIRISSSVASSIEGSTADQRGRWYVAGQA